MTLLVKGWTGKGVETHGPQAGGDLLWDMDSFPSAPRTSVLPEWGAAPFAASTRQPLLELNLFSFTRFSSCKRQRDVGNHRSSYSLQMSSWVMSPKVPEAGLRLCEKPPWL